MALAYAWLGCAAAATSAATTKPRIRVARLATDVKVMRFETFISAPSVGSLSDLVSCIECFRPEIGKISIFDFQACHQRLEMRRVILRIWDAAFRARWPGRRLFESRSLHARNRERRKRRPLRAWMR